MIRKIIYIFRRQGQKILIWFFPQLNILTNNKIPFHSITSQIKNSNINSKAKIYEPFHITDSNIEKYTYVAPNASISKTNIGKFCSIGPNLMCGRGIHPTNGISTSPMFYSTARPNGVSLCEKDKIIERKIINIGNDVFIGANVTILDGISIGDGAIIGAGAVVSKDIPPFAIAVGTPIQIKKYRFDDQQIKELLDIKWWNKDEEHLQEVEKYFFSIDKYLIKYSKK